MICFTSRAKRLKEHGRRCWGCRSEGGREIRNAMGFYPMWRSFQHVGFEEDTPDKKAIIRNSLPFLTEEEAKVLAGEEGGTLTDDGDLGGAEEEEKEEEDE